MHGKSYFVTVPDGRKAKVQYTGTIILLNSFKLHNVLFVPNFRYNLLSVNKLIKDLNWKVWFNANECFIQESLMKKPMLLGKERNSIYYACAASRMQKDFESSFFQ